MGDIVSFLLELKELRYELEINDKFFNDIETEDNRWYANIKFCGNEHLEQQFKKNQNNSE